MKCPHCRADNPADALRCGRCGVELSAAAEGETLVSSSASVPTEGETLMVTGSGTGVAAAPAPEPAPKPSTAAALLTPTPSSTPGSGSGSISGTTFALEPGSDFGPRYRIECLVGEGGMGTVYRAYDKELDRVVALKLLRGGMTADASALQRFKQELLLQSKISHKNILRIHDLGDVGGVKFISMAFIEGDDLHARIREHGRLPVDRVVKIARQLCSALEAAHAEDVVHRDLKPHNILISSDDNVYISDFGLAKSLEAGAVGMTRTGDFLGTPRYMSPEQVEGKPADGRSDLYALGLILYEMVTGDVPFTGSSTLQVMYQRVKEKPRNPKTLNPELPDYLVRIILRCLEKDPALRYQHAREIFADLDAERAPSPSRTVRIALPLPGLRVWLGVAAGVVLLLVLALAVPSVRNSLLHRAGGTARGVPAPSEGKFLAVLPFRVIGDQGSLGYIADGLVEGLSAKFFQLRDVRLASPSAVEKVDRNAPIEKIARGLGVNLVVHGTVQGSPEKIRVIVHLEDVAEGGRPWTQEFSGVPQDLLTLEDKMYTGLSAALALKTTNEELARGAVRPTENIEAYDLYLKGRNAMRGSQDIRNIQAAIQLFEQAVKKDSSFALAYTGVADASVLMWRETKDSFWSEKALAAAQQAERLNNNLPEVRFSLGAVYNTTGKTAEAITQLQRALELAPNSDEGYRRLGTAYQSLGRKEEALQAYERAVSVNPYYWVNQNALGAAYLSFGENDKALAAFQRVTELEPNNAFGYENIGNVYFRRGQYEEGIGWYQKALEIQPHAAAYSNVGTVLFFLRRYSEAVQMFEKAVEMNPNEQLTMGNLADAYRWSGQKEKAAATYDKAIALAYKELQVNPRKASTMGFLALYYAKKGEIARALDFIRRARAADPADVYLMYSQAQVAALAGRPADSLKYLREAFAKKYPPEEALSDPELQSLHKLPEFDRLLSQFRRKAS